MLERKNLLIDAKEEKCTDTRYYRKKNVLILDLMEKECTDT
jgi:hypothetical protein